MDTQTANDRLDELIDDDPVVMLTRSTTDGLLHSKPMTVLHRDPGGSFWFYIDCPPDQSADGAQYETVNLAFCHTEKGRHVSVAGHGRIVRARVRIRSMWTAAAKPFFPEGPEARDLALLEVVPVHAEFWDGPSNAVSRTLAMAASIAAGRPVGLGEHDAVRLGTPAQG